MRWIELVLWLALCLAVAGLGARWSAGQVSTWYRSLVHPAYTPPAWVFAPVWSVLYLLIAVAAWRVTLAPASPLRSVALVLFLVQLGLNLAWSWIFFRRHALATALGEILLLWVTVAATIVAFTPVARAGAWMMIPYLAWVTFAAIFNAGFWRLNP